jgi:DNA-binding response OmpR family regulator
VSTALLLVEDDVRIRRALALALRDEDCVVSEAGSGEEALKAMASRAPDVVLLDLMLPGMDGLEVCGRLRATSDIPIIIVSARSDTRDVVAGLEAGADDYVSKPLVARELVARIRALVRRRLPGQRSLDTHDVVRAGSLTIDLGQRTVTREGTSIHLTRTEFRLLTELVEAGGRVVTREELLARVWGYDYYGDTRLLDVHVRRLRLKVEADADRPAAVLTVRGAGYRWGDRPPAS